MSYMRFLISLSFFLFSFQEETRAGRLCILNKPYPGSSIFLQTIPWCSNCVHLFYQGNDGKKSFIIVCASLRVYPTSVRFYQKTTCSLKKKKTVSTNLGWDAFLGFKWAFSGCYYYSSLCIVTDKIHIILWQYI